MKSKTLKVSLIILFSCIITASTCYEPYDPYSEYRPILMHRDILENSVSFSLDRELTEPGKIYLKGDIIYINEKYKGIHVINNQDPSNPQKIGFIVIPGCIDMAIKSDILYADNSVDLVSVKLTDDLNNLYVTSRIRKVFPELMPPDNRELSIKYTEGNRPANTVIVGWEKINEYY